MSEIREIESNYSIKLDKDLEPICSVKSGDRIVVETVNAYGEHFKNLNELMDLISGKYGDKHHHPLTGPIDVDGAKAGDVLKVEIEDIEIELAAQALSKSAGISPIEAKMFGDRAPVIAHVENEDKIKYMNGMYVKYKPMLGIIGVAPSESFIKTGHAGKTGGNLDIPFITKGCSIYIPIEVDGAKLFMGDSHAAQGYGELGGIALEASSKVKCKLEVMHLRKGIEFNNIIIIGDEPLTNKRAIGIVGVAKGFKNLNEAVYDSYIGAGNVISKLIPTINKSYVYNVITAIGHSMNGQAFSKTSESTSIVNILEEDLQVLKKDMRLDILNEFESIMFKGK